MKYAALMGLALCTAGLSFAEETTEHTGLYGKLAQWQTEVEFGYENEGGNTDSSKVETHIAFEREWTKWGLKGDINAKHETQDNARSAEEYELDLEGSYNLSERTFAFAELGYEKDLFSGYEYRIEETVGLGHKLIKNERMSLDIKGALGAQQTKTDANPAVEETSFVVKPAAEFEWLINEYMTLSQTAQSTIGSELTKTELESAIKSKLTDNLYLKASYEVDHSNSVPAGKKKTDTTLGISLVYEFK